MTFVALARNGRGVVRLVSDLEPQLLEARLDELPSTPPALWIRYVLGVLFELGHREVGLDIAVSSDLPVRRGLASSAALTTATALAASQLVRNERPRLESAQLCQRAEQEHVGVRCGLLDPYTALHGQHGWLLVIDCATRTHTQIKLPPDLVLVICDSGVGRQVANSLYSVRQSECRHAALAMGLPSLRSAGLVDVDAIRGQHPVAARRAEHVVRELKRVAEFCPAIAVGDYAATKRLMAEAHASARDLFECSHPQLDALIDRAAAHPGCVGARMTGAGWGGATVNLVLRERLPSFLSEMKTAAALVVG